MPAPSTYKPMYQQTQNCNISCS